MPISATLSFGLLACALPPAAPCPQDAKVFGDGLSAMRKQMERRQWDKAYQDLRTLLEKNRSGEWVFREADAIREDMHRIVFWRSHEEPDPAALVAGTLKKYKDGKVDVSFQGRDMREWEGKEDYHVFPAVFDGPYSVTIQVRNHPADGPITLVVGAGQSPWVRVSCGLKDPLGDDGLFYPAAIELMPEKGHEETLDKNKEIQVLASRPAEFELSVTSSKIVLAHDGKKILEAKRPKMEYGQFAFFGVDVDTLTAATIRVAGAVQPSWMQNKVDAAVEEQRAAFDSTYIESEHLPEWLLAGPAAVGTSASGNSLKPASAARTLPIRPYPGPELTGDEREAYRLAVEQLLRLADEEGEAGQRAHLAELEQKKAVSPVLLAFLTLRVAEESGKAAEVLRHADAVLTLDPGHLITRQKMAGHLARLGRHAEADKTYAEIMKDFPSAQDAVEEYVWYLIDRAQISRANQVVADASAADAALRGRMDWLRKALAAAEKGPSFARTFEHESEHYLIRSDLSKEICYEASQLLEKAYTSYSVHLKRVEGLEKTRFRVFIFSGEASYHRYADDAFGGRRESTAGVYSGLVKQLLIWNLPDRADRLRTTLHEGFHQYLDAVTDDTPVWFNEGLAEYYELAETVDGKFKDGQVNQDHLRTLDDAGIAPLAEFLRIAQADFYVEENVSRNYSQAWAFVHFLRNSTRENRDSFEGLFRRLTEGVSARVAVHDTFSEQELDALEAQFIAYLDGLG